MCVMTSTTGPHPGCHLESDLHHFGNPQRFIQSRKRSNSRLDGLNVVSTTPYPAEWVDNLQVLNGLAGAMYGPQNPAGVFEYTLKRPTNRRTERLSVGVDSIGTPTVNGDISGRIGKNGWFGYRLNMLHADGTAYTEGSWIRREMVSADFDIHLDDKTVIELDASHYTYAARGLAPGLWYSQR
jgi:iron complex outermembrane receptor protein